jgi:hypothetical protein
MWIYAAAFFFRSAQRFFMARPIFLRAAADSRRLRPSGLPVAVLGMFRLPRRAAMALLRRSRSPSNSAMIDCVSKGVESPRFQNGHDSTGTELPTALVDHCLNRSD